MRLDQWLGIELRHLAALQAVAEEGTFRGAAARLGYTQSAISQQIATLEKIVGAKLVERPGGPRAVSLTETGRLVLRHAEAIIARLQAAQADVATMLDGGAGTLRVGTFQSAGARILPELVRRFKQAWPNVEVRLIESVSDPELLGYVERGDLDLSFVMPPLPDGPFAITELLRDPWVLLVPADSPLAARRQPVSLRDVADLPLIGSRLCRSREQLNSHFRARGLSPTYVFESDENTTVHGLVAAGAGVAITPKLAVNPNDERVAVIELGPKVPPRVIAIAWHRDRHRSPAAAAFVELAKELCVELEPSAGTALAAAG
ncbi:MAG TPA: LysR family transcriptional regulator [Gaiellaceae bacterium]|nr:LysR family transcriptional regulator [Gaiellaceae bacterium]